MEEFVLLTDISICRKKENILVFLTDFKKSLKLDHNRSKTRDRRSSRCEMGSILTTFYEQHLLQEIMLLFCLAYGIEQKA